MVDKVQRILEKYSKDTKHPEEVRKLSLMIFDEINDKLKKFSNKDREYLEAAALLHDIGYYIDTAHHNRHSYELIIQNGLEDFTVEECIVVGCIARYHRGKSPDKISDEGYCELDKKNRKKVKRLGGILKIADGLDRAHMNVIKKLKIAYDEENDIVEFHLTPTVQEYHPDISYAISKKDLFERGFKCQVVFKFVW